MSNSHATAFLSKIPNPRTAEAFFGVSEGDFAHYLDAVLSETSERELLTLAVAVLRDAHGDAGEGRRRRLALVQRLMPFTGEKTPPEEETPQQTWSLLSKAGTKARGGSLDWSFRAWANFADRSPMTGYAQRPEDEELLKIAQDDAAPLFMLRLELLAQGPSVHLVNGLVGQKAFRCLYELHRVCSVKVFTPSILARACECLAPEKAAALVDRIAACGETILLHATPASRLGYLWHALCGMKTPPSAGPWRNVLTDALIAAGCDPDADCFCGLTFNEIARGAVQG